VNTTLAPTLVALGSRNIECGKTVLAIAQSDFSVYKRVINQLHLKLTAKLIYVHKGWSEWIDE